MARTLKNILAAEKPEVVEEANLKASQMLFEINLAELRQQLEKTQIDMAMLMGVTQPTIAGMEKPGNDMKLSSLKKYIEALGGKLNISVETPDGKNFGFPV